MSAVSMRKYITLLESKHKLAPTAVHISVASPSDVFQHMQTKEAISPNQATELHQAEISSTAASVTAKITAAVAKVTKIIDYLITTPAAYEKGLVKKQVVSRPTTKTSRTYDVLELRIPWNIEFVKGEGFYITIARQKSSFIPGAYEIARDMIEKVYRDAGWKPIGSRLEPSPYMQGIELTTHEVILRAYNPHKPDFSET